MRYSAFEKLEIIELVERSSLSVRRTLAQIGIAKSTFYGCYEQYMEGGPEAPEDRKPTPGQVWNKLPAKVSKAVMEFALAEPARSARELAM